MKWEELKKNADCGCCGGSGKLYDRKEIGKIVQDLRKAAGLKLREISERTGYALSYISDLELGRKKWNKNIYDRILEAIAKGK